MASTGVKDQRRIRNRLAQRTTRERKAAYIQELEKQVASYQRDNANLHVQDLMKEVAELRRALQKARSKLLSIATTANSSAESLAPHLLRAKQDQNTLQPSTGNPEGIIEDKDDFSDREQSETSEGVCLTTAPHENRADSEAPQLIDAMIDGFFEECCPNMKNWLEITDSYTTIRWVLWWQVTRTAEAAADIPATNTPTPVQIALPYLSAIDWIPFPSIRNTLILSDGYDVDQVFRNMHKSFVLQKEFPVRDGSADRSYKSVTGLVQTALRATLDPSDSAGHGLAHDLWSEGPLKRTKAATSAYCQQLINFGRWVLKLDPGFFVKYPGLYDSSIVADGPCLELVNAPDVPPPKPLNMNAVNTYASLLLKDQNYHTYGMDLRIQHTPAQRRR
ncbi:hypothetical protein AYO20_05339 [Fonsecaea nubica]|uniref:BZIP domain-containing protein n=1 Tax=Fonsecaea nubica TaxID=856822 RepID=A0A178CZL9_9EURO|nr:hypothetical protein AYO20_05339 [Fonsecaea nubica]OAL35288.1 hypothetical protein AYO20_05339 [Fonsecaea nubica]